MTSLRRILGRREEPDPPTEDEPSGLRFHSRALTYLLEARDRHREWHVLDLGEADNENLGFFARRGAVYAVEGLYREILPCRRAEGYDPECLRRLDGMLRFPPGTGFDLIVAWDLLDHLSPAALDLVGERLRPVCRRGTLLYGIVSREPRIPARPARCRAIDGETIEVRWSDPAPAQEGPRYTQARLDAALDPLRVAHSYLLKMHAEEMILQVP